MKNFIVLLLVISMCPLLDAALTTYPDPTDAVTSPVYSLSIDGTPVTVMDYMDYHYAHFAFSGTVELTVTASETINNFKISPLSLALQGQTAGNTLTFSMNQAPDTDSTPRYLVITINDLEKLVILGDPPETNAPPSSGTGIYNVVTDFGADDTGATDCQAQFQSAISAASSYGNATRYGTVYVPAGMYKLRYLDLKSDIDFYLAPGAVLKADDNKNASGYVVSSGSIQPLITLDGLSHVRIRGRGEANASGLAIMDPLPGQLTEGSVDHPRRRIIHTGDCSDIIIRDIVAKDGTGWGVEPTTSDNVTVQGVKLLNHKDVWYKIQNDGINVTSCDNAQVNQCFVMTIDDALCAKARYEEWDTAMDNVEFSNNVLWNWAAGVKCGMQNDHPMNSVVFRNIDIIHCRRAIAIDTKTSQDIGQTIPIEDVAFSGIRVDEIEGHYNISNYDAVEFLLEDAPANNITITDFTLPENRPLRCGPNYPANNVTFNNFVMGGVLITNVSQVTLAGDQPINNLVFESGSDTSPPTPNPPTFQIAPYSTNCSSIAMTANPGSDPSGPVEYLFTETSGNLGGSSSEWQTSPSYTDTNLFPDTEYGYTITMRDSLGNTGTASAPASTVAKATDGGFQESGGILSMESENGAIGSRWIIGSDAGASGGAYIEVDPAYNHTGSIPQCQTAACLVAYDFNLSTAGNYRFWFRLLSTSGSDDSFFWRIDGGSWITENNRYGTAPEWFSTDNAQVDSINTGSHTLEIGYRENGTRLDKFVIQLDSVTASSGNGPPESSKGSPCCAGFSDFTCDGIVDIADLSYMAGVWLTADPAADIAQPADDLVNLLDLSILIQEWLW